MPLKPSLSPFAVLVLFTACATASPRTAPLELSDLFPDVEATVVIRDLATGETFIHDRARAERRFLPASTFKIPNTLIALETGVVPDAGHRLEWNERLAPRQSWWPDGWTKPQTLATAFPNSVVWYYQEVARQVGPERMSEWLQRFDYGNRSIGGGIDRFWLDGELAISPLEQIAFLQRLHDGELPVSARSREILADIMRIGESGGYVVSGKTGTADLGGDRELGWLVGYATRDGRQYAYALNIEGDAVWEEWPRNRRVDAVVEALRRVDAAR